MVRTQGIPVGNRQYARGITRAGVAGRVTRGIYAKGLAQRQALAAVQTALDTRVFPPNTFPYQGMFGMGAVDPETGVDDFGFDLTNDPKTDVHGSGVTNTWTPTYTDNNSGSGSGWSNVLTSFFGNVGQGIGQRIAGRPNTVVPLPSTGPSIGTVLLVAGAVAIPVMLLLRKS